MEFGMLSLAEQEFPGKGTPGLLWDEEKQQPAAAAPPAAPAAAIGWPEGEEGLMAADSSSC